MAFGQTALDSDETAWRAADKPVMLGSHIYKGYEQLVWTDANDFSDESHGSYPAIYGSDGLNTTKTMPDASLGSGNTHYYRCQLSEAADIDAIAFLGLANTPGGNYTLYARFAGAGDATFTSDQGETVATPGSPPAANSLHLLSFKYTDVVYISLEWQIVSGSVQPSFREMLIGRRRQMSTKMDRPHDPSHLLTRSRVGETEAASAASSRYIFYSNRTILNGNFAVSSTDLQTLYDLHHEDTLGGALPFVYCENPNTDVDDFRLMMFNNPEWAATRETHYRWRVPFQAKEQGANLYSAA